MLLKPSNTPLKIIRRYVFLQFGALDSALELSAVKKDLNIFHTTICDEWKVFSVKETAKK